MAADETSYRIEPCLLQSYPAGLADVVSEVAAVSSQIGARLHPRTAASLADLVRVMNCYYSNLIEGHNTRPRDIEHALDDLLEADGGRRDLQLEARAHIRVQREIDEQHASGVLAEPTSVQFIRWAHREFYTGAPGPVLRIETPRGSFDMEPGEFRSDPLHDNVVGRHLPPASHHVAPLMDYFETRFRSERLGAAARIAAIASAHHRLSYIHPFPDGNGRVARLVSHAMAHRAGIGADGLWSVSRGLARGIDDRGQYRRMMDMADSPRRGDTDGRGNLSREALIEFTTWFCTVMLDQIRFMAGLFELEALEGRLAELVTRGLGLRDEGATLTAEILRRGEVPRGEARRITGLAERTARNLLSDLTRSGLLASESPKGPVSLRFSSASAETLFPRLFPAQAD